MNFKDDIRVLISREEIEAALKRLASAIEQDFKGKNPLIVGILKGSFIFAADLIRLLDFPLEIEFVRLSSYGRGRKTAGELKVVQELSTPIEGRDVLVVEDIVDTGKSVAYLMEYLRKEKPASLKLCVLTDKPSRRQTEVKIDYLGFTVPDKFLVGYGIDYDEKYRNLPDIRVLREDD